MNDQPTPSVQKTDDKLSLTSLILGILSLVLCSIFTGIPAVITGHIAHGRAKKEPQRYGGAGQAIAGLIMGYISIAMLLLVVPILAALLLPALAKAKAKAQQVNCVNNMKQVGLAALMYANDHGEKWPADFLSMSNELNTPKILTCPRDTAKTRVESWSEFSPANVSYDFLTPNFDQSKAPSPVEAFRCRVHGNVGFTDGSVTMGTGGAGRRR